jgi:hypothetical protein
MTDRQEYIDGLRELANRLEHNPDSPLPWYGSQTFAPLLVIPTNASQTVDALKVYGGQFKTENGIECFDSVIAGLHVRVALKVMP